MSVAERRERERRERRIQIMDAAERVFYAKGVGVATMDEIAAEAQVSKGTLYLYFKSKDELFLDSIVLRKQVKLLRYVEELEQSELPGLQLVRRMLLAYVTHMLSDPNHARTAVTVLVGSYRIDPAAPNFEQFEARIARLSSQLVSAIERGRADGSIAPHVVAERAAVQLWAGSLGMMVAMLGSQEPTCPMPLALDADMVPEFIDRLLASIKAGTGVEPAEPDGPANPGNEDERH